MDAAQRRILLGRASAFLELRPEEIAFEALWLDAAWTAATRGDLRRLQALNFGWGSAVTDCDIEDGVGVIQIRGPLLEGSVFTDYSDIREAYDSLLDDGSVRAVILDIDSPGGRVAGAMWSLAEAIRDRRDEKPVVAIANDQATSAAYLIAGQAAEVVAASRSSVLGSIGVMVRHFDYSGMLKQDGVAVTEVVSGRRKNALSPYKPLSRDGMAELEALVAAAFDQLVEHVEAGRGISAEAIRGLEGGTLIGQASIDANLADRIESLDELRQRLIDDAMRSPFAVSAQQEGSDMADSKSRKPEAAKPQAEKPQAAVTTPTSDPPPTPAASGEGAEVIPIAQAREQSEQAAAEARKSETQRLSAIKEVCVLAGCEPRTLEFFEKGLDAEAVGKALLEERASGAGPEIDGHHAAAGDGEATIDTSAIYRRWNDPVAFREGAAKSD